MDKVTIEIINELADALETYHSEASYTTQPQSHPRLLDALKAKDKLVALSRNDYKTLWEGEMAAHAETRKKHLEEAKAARASLLQVSRAYLMRLGTAPAPPTNQRDSGLNILRALVRHCDTEETAPVPPASLQVPSATTAAPSSPLLPSSPNPEEEDLYS